MLFSGSFKTGVLGLAASALASMLLAGCDRQSGESAQPAASASASPSDAAGEISGALDRTHKGSELPDMTFASPSGGKLKLTSLKGKPLLINLWATWCAPCVAELPVLDKLAALDKAAVGGGLKVIAISQDMGKPDAVGQFLKAHGVTTLEPWLDPDNNMAFHYATGTLPTTVLYDAQGREVWRIVGARDWASAETAALLAEAGE